jgi:hypothetical protein
MIISKAAMRRVILPAMDLGATTFEEACFVAAPALGTDAGPCAMRRIR